MEACDCVLLAAGLSSRTTDWKMLLPCGGGTVIEAGLNAALQACARVIVVTGFRAGELVGLLRGRERVELVENPRYQEGMLSSVQRGAAAIRTQRFFLALADMPLVAQDTYRRLLEAPGVDAVIPKFHGKKGHPLLLSGAVARAVAESPPGCTLRDVLAGFATLLLPVEDPHVLHDIDTDEDYRSLITEPRQGRS